MQRIPRAEHPRPDFMRENWLCLSDLPADPAAGGICVDTGTAEPV